MRCRERFWCSSAAVLSASGWRTGSRRTGDMPERMIEITSYHAMLGCVVVGMGISLCSTHGARHVSRAPSAQRPSTSAGSAICANGGDVAQGRALAEARCAGRNCFRPRCGHQCREQAVTYAKDRGVAGQTHCPVAPGALPQRLSLHGRTIRRRGVRARRHGKRRALSSRPPRTARARAGSLHARPRSRLVARRHPHHPPRLFRASVLCAAGPPRL